MNAFKDFQIEIKAVKEDGTFHGVLSAYNVVDLGNDLIEPGAFTKTLADKGPIFPMLWQHKTDEPIGTLSVEDTGEALEVKGTFDLEVQRGREAYSLVKKKIISGLSIGYRIVKKKMENGVRHLKEIELYEGSVVTFPMLPIAQISSVKGDGEKADFATELQMAQTFSMRYMMLESICRSLDSVVWDSEMDDQSKIDESDASIEQFRKAYVSFLPDLLKAWDDMKAMPAKARTISAANRTKFEEVLTIIQALLAEPEDVPDNTSKEAVPHVDTAPPAAEPTIEPDGVHSLDRKLTDFQLALSAL